MLTIEIDEALMSRARDRQRIKELVERTNQELLSPEPISVNEEEVKYMDRALEAWAWWSYDVGPQPPVSFGTLLALDKDRTLSTGHLLNLTEDQFVLIDQAIAKLPRRQREFLDIEYKEGGSQDQKSMRLNIERRHYRSQIELILSSLYQELRPTIDDWRLSIL